MSNWTSKSRREFRESEGIPAWVPLGNDDPDFRRLWMTDDARPPDAESGHEAWERIFGECYDPKDIRETWDEEDRVSELHRGNRVYESSSEGAIIWQYLPPRRFA